MHTALLFLAMVPLLCQTASPQVCFVAAFVPTLSLTPSSPSRCVRMSAEDRTPQQAIRRDQTPVIVTDVLDTLVVDPFFNGMASHFSFDTLQQLIDAKTPQTWIDFEIGLIDEHQLARSFFKDSRPVDLDALKKFLLQTYKLLPGIDHMLTQLRLRHIPMHACTNYPQWTHLIEQAVKLNADFGVHWTFVSGAQGIRKPDLRVYHKVAQLAAAEISNCIFIDDRAKNCAAAEQAGMIPILFTSADDCQQQLKTILSRFDVHIDF